MSDVHHPLTHPSSISALVIELVMISFAVYLGVFAEQWREERHQNELARQALSNFRAEILTNRKAITDWKDYHATLLKQVQAFNAGRAHDPKTYQDAVEFNGIHLVNFEHTAWDLALATQAVAHIEPDIAFRISRVYTRQASFQNEETVSSPT